MSDPIASVTDDHEALLQFLYIAPVGLIQATIEGEIAMINPISAQLLMPLSRDGDLTNIYTALEPVAPDLRERVASYGQPSGMVCDAMRIRLPFPPGHRPPPQMLSLSLLKLDDQRLMLVLSDITQQVLRERLLRQNEAWLDAVLAGVTDYAIVRLDHAGRIEEWNASIGRITGFDQQSVVGKSFSIFYPEGATTVDRVSDRLHEAEQSGWSLDDGWRVRADGTRFWGSALISPLRERIDRDGTDVDTDVDRGDRGEQAFCLVIRDITNRREADEMQRRSIACDLLTGITNRRAFFEAAELELVRCRWSPRPLSIIRLHADRFTDVVDSRGRRAGDAVLLHIAAAMIAVFREVDVIARLGREEFAVLLPSTDLDGASAVAERLRLMVECTPLVIDGASIRCSVSGGIAVMTDRASVTLDALMQQAEEALDEAKTTGRNRIECWSADLHPLPA